jgi:hypothetical protein
MSKSLEQARRLPGAAGKQKESVSPLEVLEEQEAEIPAGVPEVHVLRTDGNPPDDGIS